MTRPSTAVPNETYYICLTNHRIKQTTKQQVIRPHSSQSVAKGVSKNRTMEISDLTAPISDLNVSEEQLGSGNRSI